MDIRIVRCAVLFLALHGLLLRGAAAEDVSRVEFAASTDYLGKYIFHGQTFSERPVVQSVFSVTKGRASAILFTNFSSGEINEVDLTLDYTQSIGSKMALSVGVTYLTFPHQDFDPSQEIYASLSWDVPVQPAITVLHDFELGAGTQIDLSIGHDFDLGEVGLSLNAVLGFSDHYYRDASGFGHYQLTVAAPIPLGGSFSLTPLVSLSVGLHEDFQDEFYAGIGLAYRP